MFFCSPEKSCKRYFRQDGLLQFRGVEAPGRNWNCQVASFDRGIPLHHRVSSCWSYWNQRGHIGHLCEMFVAQVGHVHLGDRGAGRRLPECEQALGAAGLWPRHHAYLGLASLGWDRQVEIFNNRTIFFPRTNGNWRSWICVCSRLHTHDEKLEIIICRSSVPNIFVLSGFEPPETVAVQTILSRSMWALCCHYEITFLT